MTLKCANGSFINDVTVLGGGFCDGSTKALVIKRVTMGVGGVKNYTNCMTSSMDDPYTMVLYFLFYPDDRNTKNVVGASTSTLWTRRCWRLDLMTPELSCGKVFNRTDTHLKSLTVEI